MNPNGFLIIAGFTLILVGAFGNFPPVSQRKLVPEEGVTEGKLTHVLEYKTKFKTINGEVCGWLKPGNYTFSGTKLNQDGTAENLDEGWPAEDGGYWLRPGQSAAWSDA